MAKLFGIKELGAVLKALLLNWVALSQKFEPKTVLFEVLFPNNPLWLLFAKPCWVLKLLPCWLLNAVTKGVCLFIFN